MYGSDAAGGPTVAARWAERLGIPARFVPAGSGGGNARRFTLREVQAINVGRAITGAPEGGVPLTGLLARQAATAVLDVPGRYVVARPEYATCVDTPEEVVSLFHEWDDLPVTVIDLERLGAST